MSNTPTFDELGFKPIYDGVPVLVRLISGDELLAVAYHSEADSRMMLERPIAIIFEDPELSPDFDQELNLTRVRTRFERWVSLSDALVFPIYLDHVVTVAPLADTFVQAYLEWADKLYEHAVAFRETQPNTRLPENNFPEQYPADTTVKEIRQSYFDYVLHNFKPKGKPN